MSAGVEIPVIHSPQPGEIAFCAHGTLRLHDWTEKAYAEGSDTDLYSLVMRQGAALELASFGAASSSCAQWNLAEAADCWVGDTEAPELFWIRFPVQQSRASLPLQSAGLVLRRAVDKVGEISLGLLDVTLPLELSRQDPMGLAYGRDWFEFSDPAGRRRATIDLITPTRSTRSTTEAALAEKVVPWLGDCVVFGSPSSPTRPWTSSSLIGADSAPAYHFEVTLGSDTLDFLSWVAEVLGWAVADGSEGPLLLRFTFAAEL
jgi:hypothetical protein